MSHLNLYEQYSLTKDHFVILSFKGVISQEILVYLGSMIKSSLNLQSKKIKKVFAVFIELAQNILHYSAERNVDNEGYEGGVGILQTTEENEIYYVSAGNMVKNSQIESIKKNCEYVNSLSKEDLKIYYQVKIKQDRPQGSKGAGLGFIDIARKCDGPLEYKFNQIDEKHSFLLFQYLLKGTKPKMDKIHIEKTKVSPEVLLDFEGGRAEISGESYPENAMNFYKPVFEWIDSIMQAKKSIHFDFQLEYYNTSSSKCIIDILELLEKYHSEGGKSSVKWYYQEDDDDMLESGEEFSEDLELPFELVSYSK